VVIRANVGNAIDMQNLVLNNLAPVGVAHPANTGIAFPPATLTILSLTLPDGVVGTPFSTQVNIFGGGRSAYRNCQQWFATGRLAT